MSDITVKDWQGSSTREAETGNDPNAKLDLIITMLRKQGVVQADLVELLGTLTLPSPPAGGYQFKIAPELLWAAGTAAGTVLLQALTDVDKISDYRVWLTGLGAALIRAVIGAALSQSKPKTEAKV